MPMNKHQETSARATTNVRQLPGSHQNQILSALDTLGAKLVRSENERETMRRLLNEALDAQERLENQLERSQLDMQRRLDTLGQPDEFIETTKAMLDDHGRLLEDSQANIKEQRDGQRKLEDKLRDSQQTIAKMQRRLDSQEQKRAKMQRRIERMETIAADMQNALESKALVLLTNQSPQVRQLPHIDTTTPLQVLEDLHGYNDNEDHVPVKTSFFKYGRNGIAMTAIAVVAALVLGWGGATLLRPSDKAFLMMHDGTLAQVDMRTGTASPVIFETEPRDLNTSVTSNVVEAGVGGIAGDIALYAAEDVLDAVTRDVLSQALDGMEIIDEMPAAASEVEAPAVILEMPDMTMDRDLSLPEQIRPVEDRAFEGIAEAEHDLAALYVAGQAGVAQNYERAAYWFKQAAAQGVANAAYNLGVLYHQGLGVDPDMAAALDWYRRAAQAGHPEAQYNLGIAYIEGIGTRYNPALAAAFFQQAAFGGIVEAAYNLGLILENGLVGEARPVDALRWYRGAAEQGSIEAEKAFAVLTNKIGVDAESAGLLSNGGTLSSYLGGGYAWAANMPADEEISLGSLVPTHEQIVVAQIQEQLRKMRLYNGPQDGVVGAGTVNAIKTYQRDHDLPADGIATSELLSHMLAQGLYVKADIKRLLLPDHDVTNGPL